MMGAGAMAKVAALVLIGLAAIQLIEYENSMPLLYNTNTLRGLQLQGGTTTASFSSSSPPEYHPVTKIYIPPDVYQRSLSLDLGNGACKWTPPQYDVPDEPEFHKTIIAGYPSGDKRETFIQMEALTGWPAKDEWDFEFLGITNHPFIKANYPHHEGIWGWGNVADQVVLVIRNIRRSMVEYHDILWDLNYAKTWEEATLNLDRLYTERPPIEDFYRWRDEVVMDECHHYGWFIDYWMEGGLMRDIYTNKITTPEHWNMLMIPGGYTRAELDYDTVVGPDTVVSPSYDPHCTNGDISEGCEPVAVISAEKARDYTDGPAETTKIATALSRDDRMGQYVIAPEAWDCIWTELIQNDKGPKTVYDRPGLDESDYNFSAEMLGEMISELDRVIDKYNGPDWDGKETAARVVELLVEHRALVQTELNEVNLGVRRALSESDFLGPKERERRRRIKLQEQGIQVTDDELLSPVDYEYFRVIEEKMVETKLRKMRQVALNTPREKEMLNEKERQGVIN